MMDVHLTLGLLMLGVTLVECGRALVTSWHICWHDPDDEDMIEIPDETGMADAVWFVCRRCRHRTVYTHAQLRERDLE